ncbi:MAG: hypothetical protein C4K58_02205 [Flavobacteriaceae bacterium]|nr:MAG: hypothetical protein C4K58_02205 [Flavobacteriaceae bacterium]
MKKNKFKTKLFSKNTLLGLGALGILSSCMELKSAKEALVKNLPSAYDYLGTKKNFKALPKSSTPYKFPVSSTNFLEGKTLKIDGKAPVNIEELFASTKTQALIIIKDGKVVYEKYFDKGGKETISNVWSVSKSYTAATLAVAVGKGFLKMDDLVLKYIPELKGKMDPRTKVKDLINMRSGFLYNEIAGLGNPTSRIADIAYTSDVNTHILKNIKSIAEPGTYYNYDSQATHLVTMVISKATGQNFVDFFKENLWDKLQMETDGEWLTDEKGVARGFCCLKFTAMDDAKLSQCLLQGGVWRGEQLIPKWFVDQIRTNNEREGGFHYSLSFRNNTINIPVNEWDGKTPEGARKGVEPNKIYVGSKEYWAWPYEDSDYYMQGLLGNEVYTHPASKTIIIKRGNGLFENINQPWPEIYRAMALEEDVVELREKFGEKRIPSEVYKKKYVMPKQ